MCENNVFRTLVQVAVSAGKCIGASVVGILSDKFGRRNSFASGAVIYVTASILTTFSPWYWPFLIGRFFLGSAASGLFYPALIMSTFDVICNLFSNTYFGIHFSSDRKCGNKAPLLDGHCI